MTSLSASSLRSAWEKHPDWVLVLWARNFNTVVPLEGHRLSVHAALYPHLEGVLQQCLYSDGGLDFNEFFGTDCSRFFEEGTLPSLCGPEMVGEFARNYTRAYDRAVYVLHQQGGDPSDCTINVVGYYRAGMNACSLYQTYITRFIETQEKFSRFIGELKDDVALALCFLSGDSNWKDFMKTGELYVHGERMPQSFHTWVVMLGQDGVQEILEGAEKKLHEKFPEFATLEPYACSRHLV